MKYLTTDQRYNRVLTLKIFLTLLCGAALFLIAFFMVSSIYDGGIYDKPKFHLAAYGVCALVFAFVTYKIGVFQHLLNRAWEGEITEIKYRSGYMTRDVRGTVMRSVIFYDITVRLDDGREKNVTYSQKNIHGEYYFVGMRMVHKKGAKYMLAKEPARGKQMCPLCGSTLFDDTCNRCKIKL